MNSSLKINSGSIATTFPKSPLMTKKLDHGDGGAFKQQRKDSLRIGESSPLQQQQQLNDKKGAASPSGGLSPSPASSPSPSHSPVVGNKRASPAGVKKKFAPLSSDFMDEDQRQPSAAVGTGLKDGKFMPLGPIAGEKGSKTTKPSLGVIKENKFNEAQYNNTSVLKPKSQMDYSDLVCSTCEEHLLRVYNHCMADQNKTIPSPHHIDEVADAKRKKPPPFFELLKDPTVPKNIHYRNMGEKSNREIKARNLSKRIDDFQRGAIISHFEKMYVQQQQQNSGHSNQTTIINNTANHSSHHHHLHQHSHEHHFHVFNQNDTGSLPSILNSKDRPSSANAASSYSSNHGGEVFQGSLYRHTLQIKNHEIERLREQLIEKSESEKLELENVRRLKKALSKSMRYYIKAEEWQQDEAADLQEDIRTLKKEMSVIMACLIHSESEKKELRSIISEKENIISARDGHIQQLDDQVAEMRAKLHDSLKDYIRLNEKISNMAKQAEMGSDQAEERNNILQKNLDNLTRNFEDSSGELTRSRKKIAEMEHELDFFVRQVNDLSRLKKELIKENDTLQQELLSAQQDIQKYMDSDAQDKTRIASLEMELRSNMMRSDAEISDLNRTILELHRRNDELLYAKKEEEGNNAKLVSENARLKANLKEITQKRDMLDSAVKDLNELRKNEIAERDKIIQEITEQAKNAKSEALMFEERRERAMLQLNELQGALDHEMTQNRMLQLEMERQKRDMGDLKVSSKLEIEKLNENKSALTNDKMTLTKHLYELRQELKEKKDEHQSLLAEYRTYEGQSTARIKSLEKEVETLRTDLGDLNGKYTEISTQYQSLTNVHEGLTQEYQGLLKRFDDCETSLRRTRMEYSNLISFKDNILKEKYEITVRKDELEVLYETSRNKISELTSQKSRMEKEHQIQSASRESLIANLSSKVKGLNEDLRLMTQSNNQFKELCSKLNGEVEHLKKEMQDLLNLNASFEDRLDLLRKDLMTERRMRLEFERMNQRLDQKLAEKESDKLLSLKNRDQTLHSIDDTLHREMERLSDIVEIIQKPAPQMPPATSHSTGSAPMTAISSVHDNSNSPTLYGGNSKTKNGLGRKKSP